VIKEWCELSDAWLYMRPFFDENRDETIDRLFRTSTEGDWEGWIEFCLRGVVFQARDTENRCERLSMMSLVISFQQKKIDKRKKKSSPA
jgi:Fic family protein